jgi:hypothetical protein
MNDVHEAYRPVIEDGRGIFPEDVRVKAPRGSRKAIAEAAELNNTTQSEWLRRAILRELEAVGLRLRRGAVERGPRRCSNSPTFC